MQKLFPPKIGLAGPILAEKFAKIGPSGPLLLPDWSGRTNIGIQNWFPFANFGPHCKI